MFPPNHGIQRSGAIERSVRNLVPALHDIFGSFVGDNTISPGEPEKGPVKFNKSLPAVGVMKLAYLRIAGSCVFQCQGGPPEH